MASVMHNLVREGTKRWTRTVKAEERSPATRRYRFERMTREHRVKIKEAAAEIMKEAYEKVSGPDKLPANARQIMYAARGHIQDQTGRPLRDDYFTQTLLPDFMAENSELTAGWNVVYDARGHFAEPHGGARFGLGHLEVRKYLSDLCEPEVHDADFSPAAVSTKGPSAGFGALLFIEKEGFEQLLSRARIANKFDLATMSTKGMSVTAARELADEMCSTYNVPLLLLHDFDKSGFSIAGTIQRDTRRYEYQNIIKVIDLGLSLDDVKEMKLETEYQYHKKGSQEALMENLRTNGASEEEVEFMFRDFDKTDPAKNRHTRRVELNAMTSPQFIAFVERKLRAADFVKKIVPDEGLLAEVYAGLERSRRLQEAAEGLDEEIEEEIKMDGFKAPKNLQRRVRKYLEKHQERRWDAALAAILDDDQA
jgi:hypothetical protein